PRAALRHAKARTMTRAAVLGAGAWGTTFAGVLADAGTEVTIWGRDPDVVERLNADGVNPKFLADLPINPSVSATTDVSEALDGVDIVAVALPAQHLRGIIGDFASLVPRTAVVASLMKGIEVGTHLRMSEVLTELWDLDPSRLAVVSGPNLAREIAARQPTATVIATATDHAGQVLTDATA